MFVLFSHILAFAVLFVDSLFDMFNDNNVPDEFALIGIAGGLLLHIAQSFTTGDLTPLIWSVGGGVVATVYGWAAYYKGFWGGADAMILTMMGFTVSLTATGQASLTHVLDLIFNFMISAVAVTVIYAGYKFSKAENSTQKFRESLANRKRFITGAVTASGLFSVFLHFGGANGPVFFVVMTGLLLLYEWIRVVEKDFLVKEVEVDNAVNEVPARGQGFGSQIKGLTEEELDEYEGNTLKVRTGVPLIPVFLLALLITDLTEIGFWILYSVY